MHEPSTKSLRGSTAQIPSALPEGNIERAILSAGEVPCANQRWQPLPTTDGNSVGASTKRPHHDTHPRASALARVWRCTQCTIKSTIPYLNSPVVREDLPHKGVGRRTRRLLVQVQGAATELRTANIHLLQRITDVTRRSRWAHFAETTDLHLADLRRQAEEHHRDRKPAPFPGDNSSGDRGTLCQEYDSVPRACTSHETSTPILPCYHDTDIHNRVPRFPGAFIHDLVAIIVSVPASTSESVEHPPQTSTWNQEELTRTTYTQPGSSIPNTFHNTSRLPEQ